MTWTLALVGLPMVHCVQSKVPAAMFKLGHCTSDNKSQVTIE